MAELFLLIEKQRDLRYEEQRWQAMLQGHDIGGKGWEFNPDNPDILSDDSGLFGYTEE